MGSDKQRRKCMHITTTTAIQEVTLALGPLQRDVNGRPQSVPRLFTLLLGCQNRRLRVWSILMVLVLNFHDTTDASRYPKRGINCESFCSSGFQGSIGSCNCGYIMFSKRSSSHHHHYFDYFDENETKSKTNVNEDNFLVELTDEEILDALDVLDKVKKSQHHAKELSDRELALFLWLLTSMETNKI